jgi:hypothetical protein
MLPLKHFFLFPVRTAPHPESFLPKTFIFPNPSFPATAMKRTAARVVISAKCLQFSGHAHDFLRVGVVFAMSVDAAAHLHDFRRSILPRLLIFAIPASPL